MRVQVNGVRLFVDVDGAGLVPDGDEMRARPTVVLLHGGPGFDHSAFKRELSSLRDIAQLVYFDHRGNGRSDRSTADTWSLDQWADDLRELCDVLGIERPIVLGQSFGGFVAQAYATRHPEHPSGLILSSTAGRFRPDRNLAMFERLGGAAARASAEAFYDAPGPETFDRFTNDCMALYNTRFSDPGGMRRSVLNLDLLFHFFAGEYRTFDLLGDLAAVRCPTLVLGGEEDPTTPIEDQADIAAAIPSHLVSFHRFEDCGHGAYRDRPEQALPIIRSFIERLRTQGAP